MEPAASIINDFHGEHFFLSNFYPSVLRVPFDDFDYPTGEHLYQALKSADQEVRREIAAAPTAGRAKRLGQKVDPLLPSWNERRRYDAMRLTLKTKFADPTLAEKLLFTCPALLVESNTWGDKTWGVDAATGQGHNLLGWMLMDLRDSLRNQALGSNGSLSTGI